MTRFLLIRHATNDFVGKAITGRTPGVHLNDEGHKQARRLADGLSTERIDHVFSSPLERAFETAEYLAKPRGLKITVADELHEVGFGDWTGQSLDELTQLPQWKAWNTARSLCRIPNGETIIEVQARMIRFLLELRGQHENQTLALCCHADPIKTILFHLLGAPLDSLLRLDIDPASVSVVELFDETTSISKINQTF